MLLLDDFRNGRLGRLTLEYPEGAYVRIINEEKKSTGRSLIGWLVISVSDYRACISDRNICRTADKSQRTFHAEYTS